MQPYRGPLRREQVGGARARSRFVKPSHAARTELWPGERDRLVKLAFPLRTYSGIDT
jgi:hypothetical protein